MHGDVAAQGLIRSLMIGGDVMPCWHFGLFTYCRTKGIFSQSIRPTVAFQRLSQCHNIANISK